MRKLCVLLAASAASLVVVPTAGAACSVGLYPTATPETVAQPGKALCQTANPIKFGTSKLAYTLTATGTTVSRANPLYLEAVRPDASTPAATDAFAATPTQRPVLLWLHGGGFVAGARTDLRAYAKFFARYGFVSVMPDYDLVPRNDFYTSGAVELLNRRATNLTIDSVSQSAQRDVQTAIRYLRANAGAFGINPAKVYVAGTSAGAITAVRLATRSQDTDSTGRDLSAAWASKSSAIGGAIALSGSECYDGAPASIQIWPYRAPAGSCTVDTNTAGDAPFWMFHGNFDQTLKYDWAQKTCAAYPTQCGTARFTLWNRYPFNETGPAHTDGSVGSCTLTSTLSPWVGGIWWSNWGGLPLDVYPGGDHFFSDPVSCESRAGITSAGTAGAGLFANVNAAATLPRTVAYRIWQALYPLASA